MSQIATTIEQGKRLLDAVLKNSGYRIATAQFF